METQLLSVSFKLCRCLSIVHDENAVHVDDGVDAVGDGEHGAVLEGLFDGSLDQHVCLCVDGCRRFVHKNDL